MGALGYGHLGGHQRPQALAEIAGLAGTMAPRLAPDPDWTGIEGSGFDTTPTDPTRTTAKPVCRLLTPDHQWFTDTLTIGVAAYANANGTLIGGIDRVRFHFEGNSVDVLAPTFRQFTRFDGSTYSCHGYWVTLTKPAGTAGDGHVYVEAIPADATMQSRVLGPFAYSAVDTLHDYDLVVDPGEDEQAGVSYQSVVDALAYLKTEEAQNPRITIQAPDPSGVYDLNVSGNYAGGTGRCLIEADVPVKFGNAQFNRESTNDFRPLYGGLHFRGANIVFDCEFLGRITQEQDTTDNGLWLDGVKITNEATDAYYLAGTRPFPMFVETQTIWWATDCYADEINDPYTGATLARGCIAEHGYNDFAQGAECVVNCVAVNWNSTDPWQTYVPSITITGPANSTLSLAGGNEAPTRTFTAKEGGVEVGTFLVGRAEEYYLEATEQDYDAVAAGQGYFIQDVADWINSLTGWSATVLDNKRRATAFSAFGATGELKGRAFEDVPIGSTGETFETYFDVHTDFLKQVKNVNESNVLWAFNSATDVKGQVFFGTDNSGIKDFAIIGNAVHNLIDDNKIQIGSKTGDPASHLIVAHNTVPNQEFLARSSDMGFELDAYSLIACNVFLDMDWSSEGATGSPVIKDNVIDAGETAMEGATGTVAAGTAASKVPGLEEGDFTPAGELLTNLKTPLVSRDIDGNTRAAPDAAGAVREFRQPNRQVR